MNRGVRHAVALGQNLTDAPNSRRGKYFPRLLLRKNGYGFMLLAEEVCAVAAFVEVILFSSLPR